MAIWIAVTAALGASACSATASALQHRTAVRVPGNGGALAAARATLTQVPWLAAAVLQGLGFLLHAVALRFGQLSVVQPLLVPAAGLGAAGLVIVVICAMLARRMDRSPAAGVLGIAAGILFAGQAALLKTSVSLAGGGIGILLTSWQPHLLIVVGLAAVVFTQVAFHRGPLSTSLPLVMTVNPVPGVVIGSAVYDETVRDSAPALVVEVSFLIMLTVATLVLARIEQD